MLISKTLKSNIFGLCHAPLLKRYIKIISISLTIITGLIIQSWIARGRVLSFDSKGIIAESCFSLMSIIPAFLVWVWATEKIYGPLKEHYSFLALFLSVLAYGLNAIQIFPMLCDSLLFFSVAAGLFVFTDFRECRRRINLEPRMAWVAVFAFISGTLYPLVATFLWQQLKYSTGWILDHLFKALGMEISTKIENLGILITSHHVSIVIFRKCSGVEGMFLFLFLLSCIILFDWSIFKKWRLPELYMFAVICVFFTNILRISTLFILAYWGNQRGANSLAQFFAHSIDIFHSHIGWIYYVMVFYIFIACCYNIAAHEIKDTPLSANS